MKVFFNIPQKFKAAVLLFFIVVVVLITSVIGNSNLKALNNTFSSIYQDRLIPANELFHISDLMYQKRFHVSGFIAHNMDNDSIGEFIESLNHQIDSIILDYEKTYLVTEESQSLNSFKEKIEEYNRMEASILARNDALLLEQQLLPKFNEIRFELIYLSQIQTKVGKELLHDSYEIQAQSNIIHYCQLAFIMIILLVVQAIIFNSRSLIPKKPQKYNLN